MVCRIPNAIELEKCHLYMPASRMSVCPPLAESLVHYYPRVAELPERLGGQACIINRTTQLIKSASFMHVVIRLHSADHFHIPNTRLLH